MANKRVVAYKLLRIRRDGSLGPLFINPKQRIPIGANLKAEAHLTKGFAFRPGWHCCLKPIAPHLSTKGREWFKVEASGKLEFINRPKLQGGTWLLASRMKVIEKVVGK
jgi:hypothetical protein